MKLNGLTRLAIAAAVSTAAVSTAGLLVFAGNAYATPAATATPNARLADKQILTVSGSGLAPNRTAQIEECQGTVAAPPTDNSTCDATTLDTQATTDASGSFTNAPGDANGDTGYQIYTLGVPGSTFPFSPLKCDYLHSCVLYVGNDQNDFPGTPHTFVGVTFAPPAVAPVSPSPQTLSVVQGASKSITINYGTANDGGGTAETITGSSAVTVAPAHGTAVATSPGVFKYTSTDTSSTSDSFTVGGATASCPTNCTNPATATGNPVVVNVTLSAVQAVAPVSPSPQALTVPNVSSGSITVNYGTAKDSLGNPETITGNSTITSLPAHGTVVATAPGVFKYTNTNGTFASDSFTVAGGTATCMSGELCNPASATGNAIVVNVTIQPKPTTLTVRPALADLIPGANLYLFTVSGTLTTGGAPLAGQHISFSTGSTSICSATTDASGVATCSGSGAAVNIILGLGYNGSFAGAPGLAPATGHGPLLRLAGINLV
jgi:hypothetical protein